MNHRDLGIEPGPACPNLLCIRLGMNAPFSPRFPLEVLDDISDVRAFAIDTCIFKGFGQQLPGWTDKRPARQVFVISWLFTHQHHIGIARSLAKYRLSGAAP